MRSQKIIMEVWLRIGIAKVSQYQLMGSQLNMIPIPTHRRSGCATATGEKVRVRVSWPLVATRWVDVA